MGQPAAEFFSDLRAAADLANSNSPTTALTIAVAGTVVTLRFPDPATATVFGRAFQHLTLDPSSSAPATGLTVDVFDQASTGVTPPRAPWGPAAVRERGIVAGYCDDRFHTVYQVAVGQLSMWDRNATEAVVWVRDANALPLAERAAPLWRLLHAFLAERNQFVVHGAAVGHSQAGALLIGAGGAGKSTTALACLGSSLKVAGDDYCIVTAGEDPQVHSLYSTAKLHAADLTRLPALIPMVSNPASLDREKALCFLNEYVPDQLSRGFPLSAVLAPRVTGASPAGTQPAGRAEIVRSVAPSTVLLAPHSGGRTLAALSELTHRVPTFELHVGDDVATIPSAIADVIAS